MQWMHLLGARVARAETSTRGRSLCARVRLQVDGTLSEGPRGGTEPVGVLVLEPVPDLAPLLPLISQVRAPELLLLLLQGPS
jgi:hypothetical protein